MFFVPTSTVLKQNQNMQFLGGTALKSRSFFNFQEYNTQETNSPHVATTFVHADEMFMLKIFSKSILS